MTKLEDRVGKIEERNTRVELDKAWETSWTRRIAIAILTYTVLLSYLIATGNGAPFVNALIPAIGFMLSTLAINWLRQVWQKRLGKK